MDKPSDKIDEANLVEVNQFSVKGSGCEKMRHVEHNCKDRGLSDGI